MFLSVNKAPHLPLYLPLLLLFNPMMMMLDAIDTPQSTLNNPLAFRPMHPLSADTLLPMSSSPFTNPNPLSPLTHPLPVSRKRSRDCYFMSSMDHCASFTFLGEDISSQIRQHQFEIDQFVARHAEKLRADIEERRKRNSRKLITALEEGVTHIFRAKEEEIMKMMKLNYALEEKVKSLCIENQIWRELAETKEATANALRSNLKQVQDQLVNGNGRMTEGEDDVAGVDDAQSCCESNKDEEERTLAEQDSCESSVNKRLCKSCGKGESCVLLLPCRHLCLCTVCASSVHLCPICKSTKNISVHVHMS